ncbi:ferric reductase-like transmembrane domain-containing protein [bacterium]|nr:ferric reductase-like transmembrane domain-containing protein [bacterium]
MKWLKKNWFWLLMNIIALLPLIAVFSMISVDLSGNGALISAELPVRMDEAGRIMESKKSPLWLPIHNTGEWAIRWLTVSLSMTPLMILFGLKRTRRYRKLFGLYAFVYSLFHLLFFIIDRNLIAVFDEINFILGLVSFAIMIPLALTSNRWSLQKLKKAWQSLHKWAYAAGILAIFHIALLERGSWTVYAVIIALGMLLRFPPIKNASLLRYRRKKKGSVSELKLDSI